MAKQFIKKRIKQSDIVKKNAKIFSKEIKSFNKRLENALQNHTINKNTYMTLIIDKDKKDWYKANILNKKQFKEFISNLKSANKKTLKQARKGIGVKDTPVTIYERKLYRQQFKYLQDYDEIYETNYTDIAINVTKRNKETVFDKLQKAKYIALNKNIRFRQNMKKAIDNVFGINKRTKKIKEDIDKLNNDQLIEMLKNNPNIRIEMVYDDKLEEDTRLAVLERGLEEEKEKKRAKKIGKKGKKKRAKKEQLEFYGQEEVERAYRELFK